MNNAENMHKNGAFVNTLSAVHNPINLYKKISFVRLGFLMIEIMEKIPIL